MSQMLCVGCAPETTDTHAIPAAAPLMGKADSGDVPATDGADHACHVVLRSVQRDLVAPRDSTDCSLGGCSWVWRGQVEVAEGTQGTVHVLYHQVGDPTWWQVDARREAAISGIAISPGFIRYSFRLDEHLPHPDVTPADLEAARVELIAFLVRPDGSRVFDHNRGGGAFNNVVLDHQGLFSFRDDGVCRAEAGRLSFFSNWDEHQQGLLRQGGYLVIHYDMSGDA